MSDYNLADDSGPKDIAVLVQIKQNPSAKLFTEIAEFIWKKVLSMAGLRALPQRVLVSNSLVYTTFLGFLCSPLPSFMYCSQKNT